MASGSGNEFLKPTTSGLKRCGGEQFNVLLRPLNTKNLSKLSILRARLLLERLLPSELHDVSTLRLLYEVH
jgi:hypothetical protein